MSLEPLLVVDDAGDERVADDVGGRAALVGDAARADVARQALADAPIVHVTVDVLPISRVPPREQRHGLDHLHPRRDVHQVIVDLLATVILQLLLEDLFLLVRASHGLGVPEVVLQHVQQALHLLALGDLHRELLHRARVVRGDVHVLETGPGRHGVRV